MASHLFNLKAVFYRTFKEWKSFDSFHRLIEGRRVHSFHRPTEGRRVHSVEKEKKIKHEAEWPTPTQGRATHFAHSLQERRRLRAAEAGGFFAMVRGPQTAQRGRGCCAGCCADFPGCHHAPGATNKSEDVGQSEPNRRQGARNLFLCLMKGGGSRFPRRSALFLKSSLRLWGWEEEDLVRGQT